MTSRFFVSLFVGMNLRALIFESCCCCKINKMVVHYKRAKSQLHRPGPLETRPARWRSCHPLLRFRRVSSRNPVGPSAAFLLPRSNLSSRHQRNDDLLAVCRSENSNLDAPFDRILISAFQRSNTTRAAAPPTPPVRPTPIPQKAPI